MIKIAAKTLGCKTNQYETEAILSKLSCDDYKIVEFSEKADIFLINTCCVTNKAEAKSRYEIRKIIKNHPTSKIIVTGCYVNLGARFLRKHQNRLQLFINNKKPFISDAIVSDTSIVKEVEKHNYPEIGLDKSIYHSRVPIKVQDGCNFNCAYCILPTVRGIPRSRNPQKVIEQIKKLVSQNVNEIIITGINLGLYGIDLKNYDLQKLIEGITKKTKLRQIRISSLEPMLFDEELITYFAENPKIVPHYHISLQSGCDKTLKSMKRTYKTAEVAKIFSLIKEKIPTAAIGCDVIVGFPSETKNDYLATYNFIKDNPVNYLHVFRFSERPGTAAAHMKNKVHSRIKKSRMKKLISLGEKKKARYARSLVDNSVSLQAIAERKYKGNWQAVSDHYIKTQFEGKKISQGDYVKLKPVRYLNQSQVLLAKIINDTD